MQSAGRRGPAGGGERAAGGGRLGGGGSGAMRRSTLSWPLTPQCPGAAAPSLKRYRHSGYAQQCQARVADGDGGCAMQRQAHERLRSPAHTCTPRLGDDLPQPRVPRQQGCAVREEVQQELGSDAAIHGCCHALCDVAVSRVPVGHVQSCTDAGRFGCAIKRIICAGTVPWTTGASSAGASPQLVRCLDPVGGGLTFTIHRHRPRALSWCADWLAIWGPRSTSHGQTLSQPGVLAVSVDYWHNLHQRAR